MDASFATHRYVPQMKRLLQEVLKPNCTINLNSLLLLFSSEENQGVYSKLKKNVAILLYDIIETAALLLNSGIFTEWIIETLNIWEENEELQSFLDLNCFILELTNLISKYEECFSQLSTANVYLRLCDTFQVRKSGCATKIKLAYVKLLESFLEHKYIF